MAGRNSRNSEIPLPASKLDSFRILLISCTRAVRFRVPAIGRRMCMQRPIIGVTCAYSLGIALASSIQLPARVTSLLLTFLIVLALLGFTAWSRIGPRLLSALALLCFSLLGVVFYGICAHPPSPSHLANLKEDLF